MTCKQISLAEYEEAVESNLGWCTTCRAFVNDCCEPDARKYVCDVCERATVYGAEEALMQGFITV